MCVRHGQKRYGFPPWSGTCRALTRRRAAHLTPGVPDCESRLNDRFWCLASGACAKGCVGGWEAEGTPAVGGGGGIYSPFLIESLQPRVLDLDLSHRVSTGSYPVLYCRIPLRSQVKVTESSRHRIVTRTASSHTKPSSKKCRIVRYGAHTFCMTGIRAVVSLTPHSPLATCILYVDSC